MTWQHPCDLERISKFRFFIVLSLMVFACSARAENPAPGPKAKRSLNGSTPSSTTNSATNSSTGSSTTPSASSPTTPSAQAASNSPPLIQAADLKKYIADFSGTIDLGTKTATVNGTMDVSCSKLLRLDGTGVPANGKVLFAMYDLGGGLDCLKKTAGKCKATSTCATFEEIDSASRRRLKVPFKSYVSLGNAADKSLKIAFATSGHLSQSDTDHRKLEASADCDCDVVGSVKNEPLKEGQRKNIGAINDVLKAAGGGVHKPKPTRDEDDDLDDEDKQAAAPAGPRIRTPPLRHVMSDAEIDYQVAQFMAPYVQSAAATSSSSTAMDAFVAQQTQTEMATVQQRSSQTLLGNYTYPGMLNMNSIYPNSLNNSLLSPTPYSATPSIFSPVNANNLMMYPIMP